MVTEGLSDSLGHRRRLGFPVDEAGDRAGRYLWTHLTSEVIGLPSEGGHVLGHATAVESHSLNHNEKIRPCSLCCQEQSFADRCNATRGAYDAPVPRKPVHPSLGKYFTALRLGRKWKQAQAANMAVRRGISLSYQALRGLESGETRNPSPDVLKAVAKLYERPYAEVVAEVVKHAFDIDFAVEGQRSLSLSPEGDEDEPEDFSAVRILTDRIAAGPPLEIDEARTSGHLAFSKRWLDRLGILRPLCVRVGQRERSMLGTINPGEVVLLDCADERRSAPKTDRIYAVNFEGGSTLKRLIVVDDGLLMFSDNPDKEEYPTVIMHLTKVEPVGTISTWRPRKPFNLRQS